MNLFLETNGAEELDFKAAQRTLESMGHTVKVGTNEDRNLLEAGQGEHFDNPAMGIDWRKLSDDELATRELIQDVLA